MTGLKFGETLNLYGMDALLRERGRVLLGLSGGADSSCLLVLLHRFCTENSVRLEAAHVNHMIRGEEADRDESFCRERCRELGVPLSVLRADVPALAAERGKTLEECARDVRYAYFDELTDGAGLIATAHSATDNLETVLFRMLRGTGLKGLCGIPPVRDGRILRPLIRDKAEDIRLWCAENAVPYVTDRTNLETSCSRNELRLNVLPLLRNLFPDPEGSVSRMTDLLREDEALLGALTREALSQSGTAEHDGRIGRGPLLSRPPALRARILRDLAVRAGGKMPEAGHIRGIARLLDAGSDGAVSLPGGIRCVLDRDTVRMERDTILPDGPPDDFSGVRIPDVEAGEGVLAENGFCRVLYVSDMGEGTPRTTAETDENIYKSSTTVSLCFDKIYGACRIRTRRPGDTIRFGGMTRRVKTLFSDRKLPRETRASLPFFEDEGGIVWIPGFPPRDGMSYDGTGRRLTLICQFKDCAEAL